MLMRKMMNLNSVFAASVLAVCAGGASAATLSEASYFDGSTFVYEFGARQITAADAAGSFSFLLNASDFGFSSLLGSYAVSGDISGSRFQISEVKINGTAWVLGASGSNIDLGSLSFPDINSVEVTVSGARLGAGANFQGSLVLTPVPEPETYALLLAGLGVVGFVARRRKAV
ncbi:FxDxF family PEP-CTERM protein [Paucibacter sp. B51]|uniref:FxDxF family PEP-CTERM protein n=1 Tax=Paucibacter sp. B51 TaxID=2993315 RepID=UPI0022EBF813|nr:FxDxF family PEP-CTERM protein [Paucibacter sp. B51]